MVKDISDQNREQIWPACWLQLLQGVEKRADSKGESGFVIGKGLFVLFL
jgi:L-asparaginase/Glu-tRNA(Gln) amidotransferase subunit D